MNNEPIPKNDSPGQERKQQTGIKLNFQIDDEFLIFQTINRKLDPDNSPKITKLQNIAQNTSPEFFKYLQDVFENGNASLPQGVTNESFNEKYQEYLKKLTDTQEFKIVRQETEQYQQFCRNQWEQNLAKSQEAILELTGFDLNKNINILIVHPELGIGTQRSKMNSIIWGHSEDWPNYSTIYLWHEVMHFYFGKTDQEHAIIQLLTDNELRTRLNGGSYDTNQDFEGHSDLFALMENILPEWKTYLSSPQPRNIYDFRQKISASS